MKSTQNLYLKTMYMLDVQYGDIRVTDIADKLNFTKSSVSKALVRLNNNGLIKYESYGKIELMPEARLIAEELLVKEDLLNLFFMGILNISPEQASKDVDVISEYVSEETKIKLRDYIIKSLHLDNDKCGCSPSCDGCETKVIKERVDANPEWISILKEDK